MPTRAELSGVWNAECCDAIAPGAFLKIKMLNFESLDIQVWCRKDNFKHKKHSHTINIVFQVYLQVFFKFFFLSVLVIFNLTKEKVIFISWKVVPANNFIK